MAELSKVDLEFTTTTGVILHLQPVNMDAIASFMVRLMPALNGADVNALTPEQTYHLTSAGEDMLNYAFGWGIVDNPPANDLAELLMTDSRVQPALVRPTRAAWVRKLVLTTKAEASALLAQILRISQPNEG